MKKGSKHSIETINKIRASKLGCISWSKGKKLLYPVSEKHREVARLKWLGERNPNYRGKLGLKGDKHPLWIKDRNLIKRQLERNNHEYKQWRINVWKRDNYKCKMLNKDCGGRIEAHHILGWTLYPELRYEINNGITLCHLHHPRKKDEEIKLSPYFQELVNEK